ncbi:hypothetical protein SAMN05192579_12525 [Rhodanobacter glycinis]|uniref:Uncharacterized protein n=1 Tax=Rhodanobacter glycinis TaxID=582702 RepID=A0A1I4GI53_9GAMM|nr:hypothetical protein SAMN05192579_12525 [Rhodanobacter glycinis]
MDPRVASHRLAHGFGDLSCHGLTSRSRRTAAPPLNSSVSRWLVLVCRIVCFAQLRASLSSVAAAAFRAASSQAWAFRAGSFGVVGCSSFAFVVRQHCRPSMQRRNRLTPRPSGRLRRRLTQALVGGSCWFVVSCVSPSFALACRPSPQQHFARRRRRLGLSELAVLGLSVAQASRSSCANIVARACSVATV